MSIDYDKSESDLLVRTLTTSPQLGCYVRRLVFLTYAHDYQTTKNQIQILRRCPFVEDLKIWGYNGYLIEEYQPVVAGLRCLRTLNISRRCLRDMPTDLFTYDEEYLEMLKEYPRLEEVMIPSMGCDYWSWKAITMYCKKRGIKISDGASDY